MEFDYSMKPGKREIKKEVNMDEKPLVSIITPYYNSEKYFEETYRSVMNQTFPHFEWIIVNDGSDEKNSEYLKEVEKRDKRIRVINQENTGAAGARNRGIEESISEIIIPLDADDLIESYYIEAVYFGLYFNKETAWCYTDSIGFGSQEYVWEKKFSSDEMKYKNTLVCTAGIRKSALEEVSYYTVGEKYYNEDWHLWLKMLEKGMKPVHLSLKGFWYRRNDGGALSKADEKENKRLIGEAAAKVKKPVEAIEYPRAGKTNEYSAPQRTKLKLKTYADNKKINVMMLIPWMVMGGADKFNLDILKEIDKERFNIGVITTVKGENNWEQKFSEYTNEIFTLPDFLDTKNYAEFISYYIESRDVKVIFLTNSYYGYYLVPWIRKNYPEVAIIDYIHMEEWYWRNGGYARPSGMLGNIIEKTYVCNERTRKVMINEFKREAESVETLYIGVDKEKYDERKVEYGKAKKELNISEERPCVLFPCRIHPQKRPFMMLEIAKEVRKKNKEVAFIVVGDGPQLEELKGEVGKNNLKETVYFAGKQEDMLPYYKDSEVTLICSLKEGLALTAYESFSMSRPVITSDVGGQAELVDEETGKVIPLMQSEENDLDKREFPKEEVKLYAEAILDIVGDKEKSRKLRENCRKKIEDTFSSQIMIKKLEDIFERYALDEGLKEKRRKVSESLNLLGNLADDYLTVYNEIEEIENNLKYKNNWNTKSELIRVANSRFGKLLIKTAFKLKLNKIFR